MWASVVGVLLLAGALHAPFLPSSPRIRTAFTSAPSQGRSPRQTRVPEPQYTRDRPSPMRQDIRLPLRQTLPLQGCSLSLPDRLMNAHWHAQATQIENEGEEHCDALHDREKLLSLRLLSRQMHPAKNKSSKAKPKPKVQPLQSRRSKRAEKVTAAHPDNIESFPAPPRLSIQPSQLKFLMICSVYLRQAQAEGQDEEFLDQFFNRVYHPRWPIPCHEFFCEEAAEHAKGVLFKMVRKELFWLLPFAGSVAMNMTWEEFVVLGERGLSRDKGFGEELERIRLVLRGRRGPNNLTFIQNPWGFGLLAYVRATQTTSANPLRARTSPVQFTPPGALSHKAARKGNGIKDSGENVTHWWLSVATRNVYYQGQNCEGLPMRMTSWFPLGCGNIRPPSDHGKVRLCTAPACGLLNTADSHSNVSIVAAYATSLHRRLPGMLGLPDGKYRKECATRVDRNEEKGIWCGGNLGTKDVPSTYGADRNSVPLDRPLDQENAVGGQIDDHQTSLVPNNKQSYSPNFDVHDVQRVASHASPQQGLHVGVVQSGPTGAHSLVRLHHTGPRRLAPWHNVYTQLDANEYRMSLLNLKLTKGLCGNLR
ncbi:hypothetical protein FA13DRAFT_1713840 [Coprinellus micaceus]|uniref:Uncharacterized protein n=1 Tax=Coprinellus micaceus TaxID=71717 RepID=A0A4Y7SV47_COPMI|nr:hypothetical protein FA13DRAFT_1713840 [Coprinellus micaceus]